MIRAIALSLALLLGIAVILPLATDSVEAGAKKHRYAKKRKKIKKYSKRWWRLYHARMKRKKALAARKRALRLRQIRLAKARRDNPAAPSVKKTKQGDTRAVKEDSTAAVLPTGENAPKSWKKGQSSQAELQFRVDDDNGSQLGQASISVVGPAVSTDDNSKSKSVGGVSTASLRRNVIDRMVRENGWVVNDFQKEVGGQKVYVVVAQSEGAGGRVQSRLFYFAEADGRIYSVSTASTSDSTERIAEESEKVINSLIRKSRANTQQAELNK